ncbi:hypothetical protein SLIV_00220 [Streptomyces lividans TK24]|uniref:Uncharacterized protein n=1 Tax=Streptomyces lividans TK24 TaxID=457428 RepID=A0ABN4DKD5_STRLI|nr:hypothetical protein SLIV_00220 [Streptomyces lividans TK24]QSJ06576.1 hypothetical protein SLIVDG2_00220 [Streptomyces lividans]QTD67501.1 hypothetical protein SLIVYQS_00220 [Streptomyces lividans TK24] [Streptomyces lividans]
MRAPLAAPGPPAGWWVRRRRVAHPPGQGPEPGPQVFDALGRETSSFSVGDAIEHLLVDEAGHIWVAHFDENTAGIRRWSATGRLAWTSDGARTPGLFDCYALNVSNTAAWACPHTDFPLVGIRPDRTDQAGGEETGQLVCVTRHRPAEHDAMGLCCEGAAPCPLAFPSHAPRAARPPRTTPAALRGASRRRRCPAGSPGQGPHCEACPGAPAATDPSRCPPAHRRLWRRRERCAHWVRTGPRRPSAVRWCEGPCVRPTRRMSSPCSDVGHAAPWPASPGPGSTRRSASPCAPKPYGRQPAARAVTACTADRCRRLPAPRTAVSVSAATRPAPPSTARTEESSRP